MRRRTPNREPTTTQRLHHLSLILRPTIRSRHRQNNPRRNPCNRCSRHTLPSIQRRINRRPDEVRPTAKTNKPINPLRNTITQLNQNPLTANPTTTHPETPNQNVYTFYAPTTGKTLTCTNRIYVPKIKIRERGGRVAQPSAPIFPPHPPRAAPRCRGWVGRSGQPEGAELAVVSAA